MIQKTVIKKALKSYNLGNFSVKFWDDETIEFGENPRKFEVIFKEPLKFENLKTDLTLMFAEAYMNNIIELRGDFDELARILYLHSNKKELTKHGKILSKIKPSKESSNIKRHYDLGNDFYRLWLDETMSYSCAYFKSDENSLYEAQINKIEYTLKKLDLKKGESLLDVGCGWGYLSIMAAQKYEVNVLGITISNEQYQKAKERVKELGLEKQIQIKLQNYQDLEFKEHFDKVVSVGMFEHVGKKNLALYFMKIKQVLKPGGLFLLHSILSMFEGKTNAFIDKYIFPGGYLPSLREVISVMSECDFHLLLAESLRVHYAKTLDIWNENFEAVKKEVMKKYDENFVRMWQLYLKSCASAFRVGSVDLFQFLLSKGVNNELSLTKEYIYK